MVLAEIQDCWEC